MRRADRADVAFGLGVVLTLAAFVPQVVQARDAENRARNDLDVIEARCDFYVDGSAKCPPKTFVTPAKGHPTSRGSAGPGDPSESSRRSPRAPAPVLAPDDSTT